MARLPTVGGDNGNWGTVLNQFLQVGHNSDGTLNSVQTVFNVKDYGAKGDGTTDDTTAIQNAINAAATNGRGTVFFPSGSYIISAALTIDHDSITLLGGGEQGHTDIVVTSADPTYALEIGVSNSGLGNCSVIGLTFIGLSSNSSTGGGIKVSGTQCTLQQVTVQQFGGIGIHITALSGSIFQVFLNNVYLISNGRNTSATDNLVIDSNVTDSEFHRVLIDGNNKSRDGINCAGSTCRFVDCHSYLNSRYGYNNSSGNGYNEIIGGEYETNANYNIFIQANPHTIIGTTCYGNTTTSDIVIAAANCSVMNNLLNSATSAPNIQTFSTNTIIGGNQIVNTNNNSSIYTTGTFGDIHNNYCSKNIKEDTGGNNNNVHDNILGGTIILSGASTRTWNNNGYNPQASSITTPSVPTSTTAIQNTTGSDCNVFIIGGTITAISIGNTSGSVSATGLLSSTSGVSILLKAGQYISITYSVAPTWKWFGL